MKTKIITSALFASLFTLPLFAQDRTIVNATSSEISDNLDLRAIASIFGDAKNLEDFERQLNDPKMQISNLDLNDDNQVDYLRVIESVEHNSHLIIVQSVLGRDTFQDVATIEVERDRHNNVQVQVVGDVYMYGENYIYEPIYVHTPIIYASFWAPHYHPYCSAWFWDYYPTYYYVWNPWPVFRYRNNINVYINFNNHYKYATVRHCQKAYASYSGRRANYCERQYPTRAFAYRNNDVRNRYELDKTRNQVAYASPRENGKQNDYYNGTRNNGNTRNTTPIRNSTISRNDQNGRNTTSDNDTRRNENEPIQPIRSHNVDNTTRQRDNYSGSQIRSESSNGRQRDNTIRESSRNERSTTSQRTEPSRNESQNNSSREHSQPRNDNRSDRSNDSRGRR
jgi:hypothetical protein